MSLLEDLSAIRELTDCEDVVLDVMDLVAAWCSPSASLQTRESSRGNRPG
jgi:hypothetical protein